MFVSVVLLAVPQVAEAGLFGGFATDGSYRRGDEQVCKPVRQQQDARSCVTPDATVLRTMNFAKGIAQTGANKKVTITKTSTRLELRLVDAASALFVWESGQVLGDVGRVFLDSSERWVAVEFTTRFGGRRVEDLVVMPLGDSLGRASTTEPAKSIETPAANAAPTADDVDADSKAITSLLRSGAKWAKRRKHKKAIADFQNILKERADHPEALYRLALSMFLSKDTPGAIKTLQRLVGSSHKDTARWRVEARYDKAFKKLRSNTEFRHAVGIDRAPGEAVSGYERLVAFGGKWEQDATPCDEPRISLELQRSVKRRFDLVFRSKCRGQVETTRLDGSWLTKGGNELHLHFPNQGSKDDDLVCRLERCTDDSGEDCLRCQPEPDLEFLLRVIRR